jgi:hypothetical protein
MPRKGFVNVELLVIVCIIGILLALIIPVGVRLREAGHTTIGGVLLYGPLLVLAAMAGSAAVRIVKDEGWAALLGAILGLSLGALLIFGLASLCSAYGA